MGAPEQTGNSPSFLTLARADGIPRRSFVVSVIVGTVLVAINQGDVILAGEMPNWLKIGLTYLVPYCVATYGAVSAKQAAEQTQ